MLINREVESDTGDKFIRPIQQHEITTKALGIAVQEITAVGRHVNVGAQAAIHETNQTHTEWVIRTGKANFRAHHEVGKTAFAVQPIYEWSIGQIRRCDRKRKRYCY